jgi:hypothetical protein
MMLTEIRILVNQLTLQKAIIRGMAAKGITSADLSRSTDIPLPVLEKLLQDAIPVSDVEFDRIADYFKFYVPTLMALDLSNSYLQYPEYEGATISYFLEVGPRQLKQLQILLSDEDLQIQ